MLQRWMCVSSLRIYGSYSPSTSVGFYNCGANDFGGAIALMVDSTFDLPADVVFDENYILFPVSEESSVRDRRWCMRYGVEYDV